MPEDRDAIYQLAFDEAKQAVAQQVGALDNLRGGAGTLLAVASLSTSFLGGIVLQDKAPEGWLSWAAIGAAARIPHRVVVVQGDLLDSGGTWSSTQARGSVLVVNFWASWCPPCRAEQPGLNRAAIAYQRRGVRFLGVNVNDQRAAARAYQEEFKTPYPSLYDRSAKLAARFELVGLPSTVIIDIGGVVGERFTGKTTEAALSARLDALLASGGRWAS